MTRSRGTPRELYEEPSDSFVAPFIGDANLVNVKIVDVSGEWASVRIGSIDKTLPSRGLRAGVVAKNRPKSWAVAHCIVLTRQRIVS